MRDTDAGKAGNTSGRLFKLYVGETLAEITSLMSEIMLVLGGSVSFSSAHLLFSPYKANSAI